MNNRAKGIFFCVIAAIFWGSIGIFIRQITEITPLGIACGRLVLGCLGLLIVSGIRDPGFKDLRSSLKDFSVLILLAAVMSIHFIFSVLAFTETTVANGSLLNNTMPLYVPVLAAVFLKESISSKAWSGIAVAIVGVVLVFSAYEFSFSSQYFRGNVWALISSLLFGIYTLIGRGFRAKHSSITTMIWIFGLGGILIFVYGVLVGDAFYTEVRATDFWNLCGLALVGTLLAHTFFLESLKYLGAATASTIALVSPISAALLAILVLSEVPTLLSTIGILVTLTGIAIVVRNTKHDRVEVEALVEQ